MEVDKSRSPHSLAALIDNFGSSIFAIANSDILRYTLVSLPNRFKKTFIRSSMTNITGNIGFDTGNRTVYYNATWHGNISWYVTNIIAETSVTMKVRTDMFPNMTNATAWYKCYGIKESENGPNSFPLSDLYTVSNGHRYVQFRAELKTENPKKKDLN